MIPAYDEKALRTLTCPIHISAFQIHSYCEISVALERSLCCYASEAATNVCLRAHVNWYPTMKYCATPVHTQKSNLCSNWNVVTMTSNIQRLFLFIRFGCKFDFCLCTLSQWQHIIFYWVPVKSCWYRYQDMMSYDNLIFNTNVSIFLKLVFWFRV